MTATADPSDRGPAGADGRHGRNGKDGRSIMGPPGLRGRDGAKGDKGDKGERGERGYRGFEGGSGLIIKKIEAEGGGDVVTAIFDVDTIRGQFVCVTGENHVGLAVSGGLTKRASAVGVALQDVAAGQPGQYQVSGPVTFDTWNLEAGKVYYLDAYNPGAIVTPPAYVMGNHYMMLGMATSPTSMTVKLEYHLYLSYVEGTRAIFDVPTGRAGAVRVSTEGHVTKARADSMDTAEVVGFATWGVGTGKQGGHTNVGWISGKDWTEDVGTEFLVDGADYYLSATEAGKYTTEPPTTPGHAIVKVGMAISEDVLKIDIQPPILIE